MSGVDGEFGDFIGWLQACHDSVGNLNRNLETMTVCLKNVSEDLISLIGLMDTRPLNPMGSSEGRGDGSHGSEGG